MAVAGAALVLGGAGVASADAHADGVAVGSPGVLSGNLIQIPVHIPINVCGNSISVIGLLNPAFGNSCVNDDGDSHEKPAAHPGLYPGHHQDDKPGGKPGDKPQHKPGDKPDGKPVHKPSDKPNHKPAEDPCPKPDHHPGDKPQHKPGHGQSDKPAEKPAGKPDKAPGHGESNHGGGR